MESIVKVIFCQGYFFDCINALIALAALVVSILSYKKSGTLEKEKNELQQKVNEMIKTQTLTDQGALETQIRMAISSAYKDMVEAESVFRGDYNAQRLCESAEEIYRNTYEEACAKYIDGKIDKERFKRMYSSEIKTLVEEEPHKNAYATNQSVYDCTLKTYYEWHHPGKIINFTSTVTSK